MIFILLIYSAVKMPINPDCYLQKGPGGQLIQICPKGKKAQHNLFSPLSLQPTDIFKNSPNLLTAINNVDRFNIQQPWNKLDDLNPAIHKKLPEPSSMFRRVVYKIHLLQKLEDNITEDLYKVQVYIKRVKQYLTEDKDLLLRHLGQMKIYLSNIQNTHDSSEQNHYSKLFHTLNGEVQKVLSMYKVEKKWYEELVHLFENMFVVN